MVPAALRRLGTLGLIALWVLVTGGLLLLLALSVQNSMQFSRLQAWILLANVIALIAVSVLLARKVIELVRAFRAGVPGSRLTARTVAIFGSLVIAPLIIVYLFSLEFLNQGIDSWFKVEIKQGLTDALDLSKSAMDVRMREYARSTELFANRLADSPPSNWAEATDMQRVESGALEVVVYGTLGQVLAASSAGATSTNLPRASAEITAAISGGNLYWSLEPLSEDDYLINTAAPIATGPGASQGRFVVAQYPVPPQLSRLSEAVQHSYSQHYNLTQQREGVKNLFGMTLTLVLLLAMLTAIYGAIYSAEKLTRPVQDLIAGTRAVGKGDFGTRLPLPSRDEMGFLVHSFNDMTKRLRRAREETTRSQLAVERERERLSIILARLSTGVIVIGRDLVLRSANQAAGNILGENLEQGLGHPLSALAADNPRYERFVGEITERLARGEEEWREQMDLKPDAVGGRVLVCACTPLPGDEHAEDEPAAQGGFVIVFDDISALLQAQRDAAWGEVARRLAHEIKNPLTPIQLSAERMRRRYLDQMTGEDAQILDRATYTIVQQVEAMKAMVNAFSEYARAPDMKVTKFPLNALVTEVADLHRVQESGVKIDVDLDAHIENVEADRGRVRQILNNLIVNGAEAVENTTQGHVVASTRLETVGNAEYATITVTDNGPGFSREVLGHVFDPYVTSKPKGTGLGLAIVKKIVEEHGGRVEADNRPEGGGRVRVSLPVTDGSRQLVARERRAEPQEGASMSAAHILVVDDEADIRGLLKEILSEEGYDVDVAGDAGQARASRARQLPDLVLLDIWMPDTDGITLLREWQGAAAEASCPVVMMSGHGTVETAVEATRLGAFDFVEKPLSLQKLLRTVERALEAGKRKRHAGKLLAASPGVPVGRSRIMQQLRADLAQIASNDSPVLLVGETGTGREAFARFIHDASPRASRPFVTLISSTLRGDGAEQVLFGSESGGQVAPGILERAGAGTLFINEIEDLPAQAQRALLGALESGQFMRVGGSTPVALKARLLSSSKPGIEGRSDDFRRDLLAHLNTLIVRVPPLREYTEDVPDLLRHYVDRLVDGEGLQFRKFSVAAQNRLRNYPWPDNVRELKSLVQRLLLQGGGEEIRLEEIERELAAQAPSVEPLVKQDLLALPLREAREQFERAYLQQQLLLCNGKVGQLAKRVGMERTHLYRKLRSLGVDFRNITDEAE